MRKPFIIVLTVLALGLISGPAWAVKPDVKGSKDHPIVSRIPNHYIFNYKDIEFDQYSFPVKKGTQTIEGRFYKIRYMQQKGAPLMSKLQRYRNYTNAITKIGGEVLHESSFGCTMKVMANHDEIWLRVIGDGKTTYTLIIVEKKPLRQDVTARALTSLSPEEKTAIKNIKKDVAGSKDHPLVTRIPHHYISRYKDIEFSSYAYPVKKGTQKIEGRLYNIKYMQQKGAPLMSKLQRYRNYTHAIKKIGGEVLNESSFGCTMKVMANHNEIWLRVIGDSATGYSLIIVEKQAMEQEVTADAEAMLEDISRTGHVAVYGIHFDTGKSTIKPSSTPAFKEITRLLKLDPKLNIYVVGHTDMVGSLGSNMTLAQSRANAVVNELVTKYKINKNRLTAKGVGPLCPVDSNNSKEGKAKNRRVDLVQKI